MKKKYKNKNNLINSLIKSSYIPFLVNKKIYYKKNKSIDGIYAYIFKNLKRKTLIFDNKKVITMFKLKNEINPCERILDGILKTHKLILKNESSKLCNYINEWNYLDFIKRWIFKFITYIILLLFSFINSVNERYFSNKSNEYNFIELFKNSTKYLLLKYIFEN